MFSNTTYLHFSCNQFLLIILYFGFSYIIFNAKNYLIKINKE